MSSLFSYIFLISIIVVWGYFILVKKVCAFTVLIMSTVVYYAWFSIIDMDFIIKLLLLGTAIISLLKYRYKYYTKILVFISILLLIAGMLGADFNNTYTYKDFATAYLSTFLGILTFCVCWPENNRIAALKVIAWLPIISIVLAIILLPLQLVPIFSRVDGSGFGGISMATNLAFYSVISIMASLTIYSITSIKKYRLLAYLDFGIVLLTLTRGGILAAFIVLLPNILIWIKETKKSRNKVLITLVIILISTIPLIEATLLVINRSFSNGTFNSSGRFEAWAYMISIVENPIIGNGLGNLKTLTDNALKNGFRAAHNEYVRVYYETGFFGAFIYFKMFLFMFRKVIKNTVMLKKSYVICFILAFLSYSLTDNTLTNYRFWIPFMFVLALIQDSRKISCNNSVSNTISD
ncbi:MAG: O-antigen ligase family protein [Anaerocolumna sp.]